MTNFNEEKLEEAIIELLKKKGFNYFRGDEILRENSEVILHDDLKKYLLDKYKKDKITDDEIKRITKNFTLLSTSNLYESNKKFIKYVTDGFLLKRDDETKKDILIELIDYSNEDKNDYKIVNQLEIRGYETRIPDLILYVNGLPLVVFEFKSAIREEATLHDAYRQLLVRYKRDIPELLKFNAFCVISDGINTKMGSCFSNYEFFYAWRKINETDLIEKEGVDSLYSMINGLFDKNRLKEVLSSFIFFPDVNKNNEKIICRYPQFYAAINLYKSIIKNRHPYGDGRGGTYSGATGSGKSFIMLFLTRLLMKSLDFQNPTIIIITDRNDLDDQISKQFINAKNFIGDDNIINVNDRNELSDLLKNRKSGGVFLTTIQKFSEGTELLSNRDNIVCISDEAHRSQLNLDKKILINKNEIRESYGFAKYLHNSFPKATYVGFTGTPIDATLNVFGEVVDTYTMLDSVKDKITVPIVYEGRSAKVILDNKKLEEIDSFYERMFEEGANEYQIEKSKKANSKLSTILGDADRIKSIAKDFIDHYEKRVREGSTVNSKAMFVSSNRINAYKLFKEIILLRPEWNKSLKPSSKDLSAKQLKEIKPIEKIKLVITRNKDDDDELYKLSGNKVYRKELDKQFKTTHSNFKIAIVVDMWLTGFDVPSLDTMYIDKPIQKHSLIQTISRVNRKYQNKEKGLIVDYIGIKKQMNLALANYNKFDNKIFEDIENSIVIVKDKLDLLNKLFNDFDLKSYFNGNSVEKLNVLKLAAEYIQKDYQNEKVFMHLVKQIKSAYDICCGDKKNFSDNERDLIYFYIAVRSILFKLTKGDSYDSDQMNANVIKLIENAIKSDGIEELFKLENDKNVSIDIFDNEYVSKINKIKLPNTKIKLLQKLLSKQISDFKKINKIKAVQFSIKFKSLVDKYNERKEQDILISNVLEDFTVEIIDLMDELKKEKKSHKDIGISFEEKSFYDILKSLTVKYDFSYPDDKLLILSKKVKKVVDDKTKYTSWNNREDIRAELKADLIILLAEHGYPPIDRDEVYKEIFEQAENFKKYQSNYI